MRFGLFYEHQLPRPWAEGAEESLLNDALEQIELADRLGFDHVWEVEHHFLEEYSHSSAPEVFLAAAAARTKRIRLGHGIVQLPPAFNHPARVAERIATLDLISGGRVDFGTGESSSQAELGGFGVEREQKREQWAEALDAITRMFVEEPFAGYQGAYVDVPIRNVVPKPKQKPHPPLWVACSRRETILLAARNGLGALSFSFAEPEDAKQWVDDYYTLITSTDCIPAGFSVNPNLAVVLPLMCHADEATAIERGIDGAHFFGYSLAHYYVFGNHRPGRTNIWEEFHEHRAEFGFARDIVRADGGSLGVKLLEGALGSMRGAVGTPDQIDELIRRYEAVGVDQIIFVSQAGNNGHEHVCESLELFGKEVLPRYSERADLLEAEKRERLAGAIEEALARRPPARTAPADYVVTSQEEPRPARPPGYVHPEPPAGPGKGGGIVDWTRARVFSALESGFAAFVRNSDDERLDAVMGNPIALQGLFRGMERAFDPSKAQGFAGDIQYDLRSNGKTWNWVVEVRDGRASVRTGTAEKPVLTIRSKLADFTRVAAGDMDGAKAFLTGRLKIEGDIATAARLQEMFGRGSRSPW